AVLESVPLRPQRANLLIAVFMPAPQGLPFVASQAVNRELTHDGARLLREVRRSADQHHSRDPTRLLRGHVKQSLCAAADADRLEPLDIQLVEQGKDVERGLPKCKHIRRIS